MGIFNTVLTKCPHCDYINDVQYKPGFMQTWTFPEDANKMPLDIVRRLDNDPISCVNCEKIYVTKVDVEIKILNPRVEKYVAES